MIKTFLFSFLVSFLLTFAPRSAAADDSAPFAGTYRWVGGAREDQARLAAIDKAVDGMFFALRPIARSRLGTSTRIASQVTLAVPAARKVRYTTLGLDVTSSDDGTPASATRDGESLKVAQRVVGNRILQTFTSSDGRRTNELVLVGDTLTMRVTVESPKLPAPVSYVLTYKRAS